MKKAILTIGLFTTVLATTSFASPTVSTSPIDETNSFIIIGRGGQDSGGGRKIDYTGNESKIAITAENKIFDGNGRGGQDSGGGRKID